MIKVNDNARDQVKKLLAEDGCPEGSFVRVGVKGGGCSGLMYQLDFDHEMQDDDQVFEDNGVKVVVDKKSFSTSWEPSCATRRPQRKGV